MEGEKNRRKPKTKSEGAEQKLQVLSRKEFSGSMDSKTA